LETNVADVSWHSAIADQKISDFEVATMLISEQEFVTGKPLKTYPLKGANSAQEQQDPAQTNPRATGGGSYCDPSSGSISNAKITGGEYRIDRAHVVDAIRVGAGIAWHARATLMQDAFTQTITQGANIQFSRMTLQLVGHDLTDDYHVL